MKTPGIKLKLNKESKKLLKGWTIETKPDRVIFKHGNAVDNSDVYDSLYCELLRCPKHEGLKCWETGIFLNCSKYRVIKELHDL